MYPTQNVNHYVQISMYYTPRIEVISASLLAVCEGIQLVTGGFPAQTASNKEGVPIP